MKVKYIVISEERGIFLGALSGYALFSKVNPLRMHSASGFDTLEQAQDFIKTNLPSLEDKVSYHPIPTHQDFVSCVDIIKQGYGKHTYDMMDYLDMPSESVH